MPLDVAFLSPRSKIITVILSRVAAHFLQVVSVLASHSSRFKGTHQRGDEARKTLLAGRNLGQNPALTRGPWLKRGEERGKVNTNI